LNRVQLEKQKKYNFEKIYFLKKIYINFMQQSLKRKTLFFYYK